MIPILDEDVWSCIVEVVGDNEWLDRRSRDMDHKSPVCAGLSALALISKSISPIAQRALFRRIYLSSYIRAYTFLTTVKPRLATYVDSLEIDLALGYGHEDYQSNWPWIFWLSSMSGLELLSRLKNTKILVITGWDYLEMSTQALLPPAYHDEFNRTRAAVCKLPRLRTLYFLNNIIFNPSVWLVPITSSGVTSLSIIGTDFIEEPSQARTIQMGSVHYCKPLNNVSMSYENMVGGLGEQLVEWKVLNMCSLLELNINMRVDCIDLDLRRRRYEGTDPLIQFLNRHGEACAFPALRHLLICFIKPDTELFPHQATDDTTSMAPHLIGPELDDLLTSTRAFESVILTLTIMKSSRFTYEDSIRRIHYLLPKIQDRGRLIILVSNIQDTININ